MVLMMGLMRALDGAAMYNSNGVVVVVVDVAQSRTRQRIQFCARYAFNDFVVLFMWAHTVSCQ